jgi:hypothetical protein
MDRVVGGWSISSILQYKSGTPTEVYGSCGGTAGDVLFGGCHFTGSARVNIVPGVKQTNKSNFNPLTTPFWNAAAFSPAGPLTFGTEARSLASARGFASKDEDFTLGKKTRLFGERASIDFRASFFNIFNRHVFGVGNGNLGSGPFIPAHTPGTCPGVFACGFGALNGTQDPRSIQFTLKVQY